MLPNHNEWFRKTFGEVEGAWLESSYQRWVERLELQDKFQADLGRELKLGCTDFVATALQKSIDPSDGLMRAVTEAMVEAVPLYQVRCKSANRPNWNWGSIGEFVYVERGFRYINRPTLFGLSTAPKPVRILKNGQDHLILIINRVRPVYPAEARAKKLEGNVRLRVLVEEDRTVSQISFISGDPMLVKAAIDAVKQWRYQPMLINGNPVEVDMDVEVSVGPRQ